MKKIALLILAALVLSISLPASAQQFPDVPTDHWAYAAVQQLVQDGVIQGYPDGVFAGKHAVTRYEFAEALSKAIPAIQAAVKAGIPATAAGRVGPTGAPGLQGPRGTQGPAGPQGTAGVNIAQIAAMQSLVNQFRTELAGIGVNVAGLKKDLAALQQRVAAVEAEQARVKFSGELSFMALGAASYAGTPVDRDGRFLPANADGSPTNLFRNIAGLSDFALGVDGKVSDTVSAHALIDGGNYVPYELADSLLVGPVSRSDKFFIMEAYADAALKLPLVGKTNVTAGRFPFQLTPYTMKFIDPDSYSYLPILDDGNFFVDGVNAQMNFGSSVAFNAFAAKSNLGNRTGIGDGITLINPSITVPGAVVDLGTFVGGRAVVGTPWNATVGLTYLNTQVAALGSGLSGQTAIYGADVNAKVAGIGVSGSWQKNSPDSAFVNNFTAPSSTADYSSKNSAWNAMLSYQTGKLGVDAGYTVVETNYVAPGNWNRMGNLVNPTNIKGIVGDVTYAFAPGLSFVGGVQFLQANDASDPVMLRFPASKAPVNIGGFDKFNSWKAGLKYSLTSSDSVDLGLEQVELVPLNTTASNNLTERFISIGYGHMFSSNASFKLMYQIVEESQIFAVGDSRGGVASAEAQFKF